ncbi:MAG TPA: DMT family transporter [Candidatus Saccharimonadales bacterium]|nr:DMT family transporter [Candidatus Saccharimonadales bacterium]
MLQIIFLYSLYAVVFIFGKQALLYCQPIFLTGVRMITAGLCTYVLYRVWFKSVKWSSINLKDWWYIFLLAVFNVYLTNANEAWSLQYLSSGKVAFMYNLSPFFALFFSHYMFGDSITWKKILGMIISCCAITPLLISDTTGDVVDTTMRIGFFSVAEIVMIVAAAATAYGWVIMKYLMDRPSGSFNSYFLNGISLTIGGLFCLMQAYFFEVRPFISPGHSSDFVWFMLIMMLLQNIVAYNFNAYLLTIYSATLVILFSFVMPIVTALLGWIFLKETLTVQFFLCTIGVALGLFVFYQEELYEDEHTEDRESRS